MYPHDVMRKRLLEQAGISGHIHQPYINLDEIYRTQWDSTFEQYMRNRLAMGYFRYGSLRSIERKKMNLNHIGSAKKRLDKYLETGNQEYLVDVANLCMVEFIIPSCHSNPYFNTIDDGEHTG